MKSNACVDCLADSDCKIAGTVCVAGSCVKGATCASTVACKASGQVCDAATGHCVDCVVDADCGGGKACLASKCMQKTACATDKDCTAVCGMNVGYCVQCNVTADCSAGYWCSDKHTCRPAICANSACVADAWLACAGDGSKYLTPVACDDGNACTGDTCDGASGCLHANTMVTCDDGSICTADDTCIEGHCMGKTPKSCGDGNPCTIDACNPPAGCTHTATTGGCDDNDACTTKDFCKDGTCVGGEKNPCDDSDSCSVDSCDAKNGCTHTKSPTTACTDNNVCTAGDSCGASGCQPGPNVNCDDSNQCTTDSCDPSSGCSHVQNVISCDDGDGCTSGDTCVSAVCTGKPDSSTCGDSACKCGETPYNCPADCGSEPPSSALPAGTYLMGSALGTGNADEHPQHSVTVSGFHVDKGEVTIAQYAMFFKHLAAENQCNGANSGKFFCGQPDTGAYCNWGVPGSEQQPLTCVDWFQASAYCAWAHKGGRLPTEAEWEYAARSGGKDQTYGWGNEQASCKFANMSDSGGPGCGTGATVEVCSKAAGTSAQGACDLAGNAAEWCGDWLAAYGAGSESNPTGPATGVVRVVRGGSWANVAADVRASSRSAAGPNTRDSSTGFRCAKKP